MIALRAGVGDGGHLLRSYKVPSVLFVFFFFLSSGHSPTCLLLLEQYDLLSLRIHVFVIFYFLVMLFVNFD